MGMQSMSGLKKVGASTTVVNTGFRTQTLGGSTALVLSGIMDLQLFGMLKLGLAVSAIIGRWSGFRTVGFSRFGGFLLCLVFEFFMKLEFPGGFQNFETLVAGKSNNPLTAGFVITQI